MEVTCFITSIDSATSDWKEDQIGLIRESRDLSAQSINFSRIMESKDLARMERTREEQEEIERDKGGRRVRRVDVDRQHRRHRHQPRIVRYYKLLNRCSNRYVRVTGKHVDANSTSTDQYVQLRVESQDFDSQLTIQSAQTQNYLCFNKQGKLALRLSARDGDCLFHELISIDEHYTEFRSTVDSSWFIAFNTNGRCIAGNKWMTRPHLSRCRHFLKIDVHDEITLAARTRGENAKKLESSDLDFRQLYVRLKLPK